MLNDFGQIGSRLYFDNCAVLFSFYLDDAVDCPEKFVIQLLAFSVCLVEQIPILFRQIFVDEYWLPELR